MNTQSILSKYGKELVLDISEYYDVVLEENILGIKLDSSEYYDVVLEENILGIKLDSSEYFDIFLCGDEKDYIINYEKIKKIYPYILTEDLFILSTEDNYLLVY